MGKLKLSLDALRVTSFETDPAGRREDGTVHAHAFTTVYPCRPPSQAPCFSAAEGCFSSPDQCTGSGCDETLAPTCVECRSADGGICDFTYTC